MCKNDERKKTRQSVSRVLSAPVRGGTTIRLGRALRRASRDQPGRQDGKSLRYGGTKIPHIAAAPIRSCSRWGLPCRPCCQGRGALLPHRFALARGTKLLARIGLARAVCFLWHCPWGCPRRPLAGIVFPWSPDFPPPTQSASTAAVRLSGAQRCAPVDSG